jgi:nitrate/TMAO reductase-like tetraheme cytochrome c subunit
LYIIILRKGKEKIKKTEVLEMEELKLKMEAKLEVYESLINGLEEDNKFKTEYEAKAEELKQLLNEMGC